MHEEDGPESATSQQRQDSSKIVFRKKVASKIRVRRKATTPPHNPVEEEDLGAVLRETRQIQKERERGKGCEASALSSEVLSLIAAHGGGYSVVTNEEDKEGGLQSTFIVQQDDGQEVNPLLEQYIQQGLKEFREKKAKTVLAKQKESGIHAEEVPKPEGDFDTLKEAEKQLYVIPEHLKAKETAHSDDTISESWLTGIQEVELPMEYKLQNIEATENARKQLLERQMMEAESSAPPFNTRFQKANSETQSMRPNPQSSGSQKRVADQPGSVTNTTDIQAPQQATDDIAFDRFKKRFRY